MGRLNRKGLLFFASAANPGPGFPVLIMSRDISEAAIRSWRSNPDIKIGG
jgi:hypothetical protein